MNKIDQQIITLGLKYILLGGIHSFRKSRPMKSFKNKNFVSYDCKLSRVMLFSKTK